MKDLHYPQEIAAREKAEFPINSTIRFKIFDVKGRDNKPFRLAIETYAPDNLTSGTSPDWGSLNIGAANQKIDDALNGDIGDISAGGVANGISTGIGMGFNSVIGMVTRRSGADLNSVKNKETINPYTKVLFQGTGLRTFVLDLTMFPRKPADNLIIKDIVREFKRASSPEGLGDDVILGYPSEIEVEYLYKGKESEWLPKRKRCVLGSVSVSYGGFGVFSTNRDGGPVAVSIQLPFQEIEIITKVDIDSGY